MGQRQKVINAIAKLRLTSTFHQNLVNEYQKNSYALAYSIGEFNGYVRRLVRKRVCMGQGLSLARAVALTAVSITALCSGISPLTVLGLSTLFLISLSGYETLETLKT